MISPYERIAELTAAGRRFALATVVRTHGSTPQVVGAKLILSAAESERPFGTLGGGCVEADAVLSARQVLTDGGRVLREYQLTEELAWNTGLVCGGTMWILAEGAEALTIGGEDLLALAVEAARGGPPMAFVTRLAREGQKTTFSARSAVLADGRMVGTLGASALDERARDLAVEQMRHGTARLVAVDGSQDLLIDPVAARPRLVIGGGGHVAKALARQARLLDFDVPARACSAFSRTPPMPALMSTAAAPRIRRGGGPARPGVGRWRSRRGAGPGSGMLRHPATMGGGG
jgi:xanthine dehydrogenase accessory factor